MHCEVIDLQLKMHSMRFVLQPEYERDLCQRELTPKDHPQQGGHHSQNPHIPTSSSSLECHSEAPQVQTFFQFQTAALHNF